MTDPLRFTLALESEPGHADPSELDDLLAELLADLNAIDPGCAVPAAEAEAPPDSKAIGTFLLGVLSAEVNGKNMIKVVQYLRTRLLEQPHPPIRIKLARTDAKGATLAVEVEGAARDRETVEAWLSQLEATFGRLG